MQKIKGLHGYHTPQNQIPVVAALGQTIIFAQRQRTKIVVIALALQTDMRGGEIEADRMIVIGTEIEIETAENATRIQMDGGVRETVIEARAEIDFMQDEVYNTRKKTPRRYT